MNTTQYTTAIAALTLFASAGLAQDFSWDMPVSGSWADSANWSPMTVPNDPTHNAFVSVLGTYTINIPSVISTFNVNVTNPNATLILQAGNTHNIYGNFYNDGLYQVNPTSIGSQTNLLFQSSSSVSGSGMIQLGGFDVRARLTINPGATLDNTTDHTIAGFGRINGDITNNGLIDADVSGQILNYSSGSTTNNALMLASAGSLNLANLTLTQHPLNGVIRADGGSVQINGTTITNGTVEGLGTIVEVKGTSTFTDVTTNGDVRVQAGRVLNINTTLDNNGTIGVNLGGIGSQTTLNIQNDTLISGNGNIQLDGFSNRSQITTTGSSVITHGSNHTIHGYGRIIADMVNNGQITADANNQILTVFGNVITNNGGYTVTNNAFLDFSNTTVNQSASSTIDADNGEVRYASTTISGGSLTGTTGVHRINGANTFDQVTSEHEIIVSAGGTLNVSGSIINNDGITVNPGGVGSQTTINFLDSSSLAGTGTVVLDGFSNRAQITAAAGMTVTQGADHTIMGYGRITTDMVNDGVINASVGTQKLTIQPAALQNTNLLTSTGGAILELANSVVITQSPAAQIFADDGRVELSGTTIIGGQLNESGVGDFLVDASSAIDGVTSNADITVQAGQTLSVSDSLTNNGLIIINHGGIGSQTTLMLTEPLTISGSGELNLNGFYNRAQISSLSGTDTLTNASGHSIIGTGRIDTPLLNNGTLAIGASVGEMDADAPVTMGSTGIMMTEVNNFNSADILDSSSTFHAAGTLNIALIDGFAPATAWIAKIVTADGGVTGEFDTVNFPGAPADPRLVNSVGYFDNEIRIGAICKSDVNFSGDIDFLDISQFLGDYNGGNLRADLNGDMQLDFLDISIFIQSYTGGCP